MTSTQRKEWRLGQGPDEWVVIRWADVSEQDAVADEPLFILQELRHCTSDLFGEQVLLDLCRELWGCDGLTRNSRWTTLLPRLEDEFRYRRLVLVRLRQSNEGAAGGGGGAAAPVAAEEDEAKTQNAGAGGKKSSGKKRTWVAIRLVGDNGRAVTNERYRLVLPDGSVNEGTLNASGEAWVEDIDPGECTVSFPDIDAREWNRV